MAEYESAGSATLLKALAARYTDAAEATGATLAADMLRIARLALRKTKEGFNRLADLDDFERVVQLEGEIQRECMSGPDFQEGLRAFAEKRPPKFSDA